MIYKKILVTIGYLLLMVNFASAIVYENGNQGIGNWYIYDNNPAGASVTAIYDHDKQSNVIQLAGSGTDNGYMIGSFDDALSWNNSSDNLLSWDMNFNENFVFFIRVNTLKGYRYLYYTAHDVSYGQSEGSSYVHFGLGSNASNGIWKRITRDLALDVKQFEPDNQLLSVHTFLIRGSGKIDNIQLNKENVNPPPTSSNKALILYDDAGAYGHMGVTNAIFLENLLGHFGEITVTSKPVSQYVAKEMSDVRAVFYLGTTYDALANYANGSAEQNAYYNFYRDVATEGRNIIWINYNLNTLESFWQSENLNNTTFAQQFGISFAGISQGQYNRVTYKNTELYKGVIPFATPGAGVALCADEGSNRYACALELNKINIVDQAKTQVFATTYSTLNTATTETPYITRASNFWVVGDIPFTYMSEEDRYLAFSDALHEMLEIPHSESHKAIMRLEDVDARTNMNNLNNIAAYMDGEDFPFSVATIPQYEDPLGIENNGVATTVLLSNSAIGARLKELYDAGTIDIVQHGTTHQYHENLADPEGEIKNPYNGLSGDDFEFMRVIETDPNLPYSYLYPTMNDSASLALQRILHGKTILDTLEIEAFAWEAPHYMAGPNHYRGIAQAYPVQYARMLYYPFENSADASKKYEFVGQFFPYMIQKDIYGYTIIPENIHNVEDVPNTGYRPLFPSDTIRFAKKLKVVRDGVASFFYHPYLGTEYLKQIVEGLKAEGYEPVSGASLVQ